MKEIDAFFAFNFKYRTVEAAVTAPVITVPVFVAKGRGVVQLQR